MTTPNDLDKLGLKNIKKINHNLSYDELFELEKAMNEGRVSSNGTFCSANSTL